MVTSDKTIEPRRAYTIAEMQELLGGMAYRTALRLIHEKQIKAKRVGKGWLILGSSILDFLEADDDDN